MIAPEQYQLIKHYVMDRLSRENPFTMHPEELRQLFKMDNPVYRELCRMSEQDGMPFYSQIVRGGSIDGEGDPTGPIIFQRLPNKT